MTKDPAEMFSQLGKLLKELVPPLQVSSESEGKLEVKGTKEAMQGKQKVDGFYFASLVQKTKDVRFYFFPIYTHADAYKEIPESLEGALKGKSCFHIKKLDEPMEKDIRKILEIGIRLYQKEGLI